MAFKNANATTFKSRTLKGSNLQNPSLISEAADMAANELAPVVPATNAGKPTVDPVTGAKSGPKTDSGANLGGGNPNPPQNPPQAPPGAVPGGQTVPGTSGAKLPPNLVGADPVAGVTTQPPADSVNSRLQDRGFDPDAIKRRLNEGIKNKAVPGGLNPAPKSMDDLYDQALRKLLGEGPRDTAEEEALLREQMQRDVGAGQANLNARMAGAGFGTSGALSALGTDMRSRAAFDAANSIQGVRQDARDEFSRNAQAGLGAVNQDRNLDINEAKFQAYIDAMNNMFGPEPGAPTGKNPRDAERQMADTNNDGEVSEEEQSTFNEGVSQSPAGAAALASREYQESGKSINDLPTGTPSSDSVRVTQQTDRNGDPIVPQVFYDPKTKKLFKGA